MQARLLIRYATLFIQGLYSSRGRPRFPPLVRRGYAGGAIRLGRRCRHRPAVRPTRANQPDGRANVASQGRCCAHVRPGRPPNVLQRQAFGAVRPG